MTASHAMAAQAGEGRESEEVRRARQHYKRGEEAFNDGRFQEAYREFEAGYALVPRPAFLLNMAHAERKRGELRNARALYKKYLLVDPDSNLRGEVEKVVQEIDSAITAEEAAAARAAAPLAPPPVTSSSPVTPPPAAGAELFPGEAGSESGRVTGGRGPSGAGVGGPPGGLDEGRHGGADAAPGRWWMWATVGGVIVAGVATALLLARSDYQRMGDLGTLR